MGLLRKWRVQDAGTTCIQYFDQSRLQGGWTWSVQPWRCLEISRAAVATQLSIACDHGDTGTKINTTTHNILSQHSLPAQKVP